MIRRILIATVMFVGLGPLILLINSTAYWFWAYAFFERDRIQLHSGRNLLICLMVILLLATAEVVLGWLLFRSLYPKRFPNHCLQCNYNLTGNISGRCPECGQPTDAAAPNVPP